VTLQPLSRFELDAAILFSDILTVPDAMGLGLYFAEGEGPKFERPLREEWAIRDLTVPDPNVQSALCDGCGGRDPSRPGRLGAADRLFRQPVDPGQLHGRRRLGFGDRLPHDQDHALRPPDLLHHILGVTATAVTDYLNAQIESGAQAVMIFDSWGGVLSHAAYREFSLAYMQRILAGLKRSHDGQRVPSIVFTKGGGQWLEAIAGIGCDAVGLDWTTDLGEARRRVGSRVALQGNLDPMALFAAPEKVAAEARRVLDSFGAADANSPGGHVFNLGHGISQFTPPENVKVLVDTVHSHSRRGFAPG
jgi:uroporphyrinogen decarboxylase